MSFYSTPSLSTSSKCKILKPIWPNLLLVVYSSSKSLLNKPSREILNWTTNLLYHFLVIHTIRWSLTQSVKCTYLSSCMYFFLFKINLILLSFVFIHTNNLTEIHSILQYLILISFGVSMSLHFYSLYIYIKLYFSPSYLYLSWYLVWYSYSILHYIPAISVSK